MILRLVLAIVVLLAAIVLSIYYTQPVPHGMPPGEEQTLRMLGVVFHISKKVVGMKSVFGDDFENYFVSFVSWVMKMFIHNPKPPDGMETTDTTMAGVPVRVYKPLKGADKKGYKLPGLVYYHGGGWTFGNIDITDELCYTLSKKANIIIVSVGYRLAPEYPFPAPFDDCYDVASTLLTSGEAYGIDPRRVIIGGDSAGGNLAAAVTLRLKNHHPPPAGQLLIYPAVQFSNFTLPSMRDQGHLLIDTKQLSIFWSLYINGSKDLSDMFLTGSHAEHLKNTKYATYIGLEYSQGENLESEKSSPKPHCPEKVRNALTNPKAAPLMADDLSGLPPTLLITAQFDVLASEGFLYKERLQDAAVEVTHYVFPSFHGFFSRPFLTDESTRATSKTVAFLKQFDETVKTRNFVQLYQLREDL